MKSSKNRVTKPVELIASFPADWFTFATELLGIQPA